MLRDEELRVECEGGSTTAVVEHLLTAVSTTGTPVRATLDELRRGPHQLHEVDIDGRVHWLQINHHQCLCALWA
ncbi:hypothetical protein [Saccharopolyspora hattusasensis]|uniref:hypothetical protein n=1 Tax=Saccharopolyspora hattusasensis TaxID=1128679 RepID=UPI003D95F0AC